MSLFDQFETLVTSPSSQWMPQADQPAYLAGLNQSIDEVWQKMETLFLELGKAYYEQHMEDHQTEYEDQLSAIRDAHAGIDRYQKLVDEIASRKRCPACGAELMEGSVFCNICGIKILEGIRGSERQDLCPQCHAPVGSEDAFCTLCGADLRNKG